jgi:hypothetical protein
MENVTKRGNSFLDRQARAVYIVGFLFQSSLSLSIFFEKFYGL